MAEIPLRRDLPRGDFETLPPWWREAVRSLCWCDAAFALAPPDDYRFGLFADDLQSCAALLYVTGTPEAEAWRILCERVPVAAKLAHQVAPTTPPKPAPKLAAVPAYRAPKPVAWRDQYGVPQCEHGYVTRVSAGFSHRTGRPYRAFWSCPARVCRIPDAALDYPTAAGRGRHGESHEHHARGSRGRLV